MPRIGTVIRDVYRRPGAEALPGHLEERYGIRVAAMKKLDAGVFLIQRDSAPDWVARMFVTGRPAERAEGDAEVLGFLARQHVAAERCADPQPVSALEGRAVLVTEHVPGGSGPATPAGLRALGEAVGRLSALATEPGPTRRPAGSLHHLPDFEGGPGQDVAAARALLADLDGRVPARYRAVHDSLRSLLPEADACAGLPESFIHPDPVPANLIAAPAGPLLVDWTAAGTGPRLAALAVALQAAGPRQAGDVMAGYLAHADLTADEAGRLEGALWVRALWRAAWQCWLAVVSAKVDRAFVPDRQRITAIAARACAVSSAWRPA